MIINAPPHQQQQQQHHSEPATIYTNSSGTIMNNHQHQIPQLTASSTAAAATYFQPQLAQPIVAYNSTNYCVISRQDADIKPDLMLHIRGQISNDKTSSAANGLTQNALNANNMNEIAIQKAQSVLQHPSVCT